jgi:uncharacterized spore protein YtfJ
MNATETIDRVRDALSAKVVYGEPYEKNGLTVIPAASVKGGGGGGEGDAPEGQGHGAGSGIGLVARPAGAYVIDGDQVTWRPAFDRNRAFALGALVALALIWTVGRVAKARGKLTVENAGSGD